MSSNIFFKKKNIKVNILFPKIKFKNNFFVGDVKPLKLAKKNDITFFDNVKYKADIKKQAQAFVLLQKN